MPSRLATAFVTLVLVGATCSSAQPAFVPSASPSLATGCSQSRVDSMVRGFVIAFNGGRVDDLVSSAFVWFSFNAPDVNDAAYGPDDGLRYLRARQAAGDRMELTSLQVNGERSWDRAWGFGYAVTVTRAGRQYLAQGKGELYCDGPSPGLSIWSMGAP